MGYTDTSTRRFPSRSSRGRIAWSYCMRRTTHSISSIRTDGTIQGSGATWFGHSIGKWDGDTLVVDTIGFNEKTLVDTFGHPHSDALHVIERFTLTDAAHIAYEITIEDRKRTRTLEKCQNIHPQTRLGPDGIRLRGK